MIHHIIYFSIFVFPGARRVLNYLQLKLLNMSVLQNSHLFAWPRFNHGRFWVMASTLIVSLFIGSCSNDSDDPSSSEDDENLQTSIGKIDANFAKNFQGGVYAMAVQKDGKVVISGSFRFSTNDYFETEIVRINSDGTRDATFNCPLEGHVGNAKIIALDNGKILTTGYVSGTFGLVRLNSDGSVDNSFNGRGSFSITSNTNSVAGIRDFQLLPSGKILVSGNFELVNNVKRSYIIRLNPDGSIDDSFQTFATLTSPGGTPARGYISSILPLSDGKIIIAGVFYPDFNNGGYAPYSVARLLENGQLDTSFGRIVVQGPLINTQYGPEYLGGVDAVLLQNGRYLIAGNFTYVNDVPANFMARINSNATIDNSFSSAAIAGNARTLTTALSLRSDGKILVGRQAFQDYDNSFWVLDANGAKLEEIIVNGGIYDIAVKPDNSTLLAGEFERFNNRDAQGIIQIK